MARARNIKPGFYANEDLAECSVWARFIFPGLWMLADREGRLEDRPKRIKGELLRFDGPECEPLLQELAERGFLLRYQVGELRLIQVVNFARHQSPHHREPASRYPAPPGWTPPKPGASIASDAAEASGEPEASPGLLTDESTSQDPKAALIPDSGSRIADFLNPEREPGRAAKSRTVPACPHRQIVELYNEILAPHMPEVRLLQKPRQSALTKRWRWLFEEPRFTDGTSRATTTEEALSWFRKYFELARENDFLTGRTPRSPQHKNWKCDLDFLLTDRGLNHVIEKTEDGS